MKKTFLAFLIVLMAHGLCHATTVNGISGWIVSSQMMNGMEVTATYLDNGALTTTPTPLYWGSLGATQSGVIQSGWSITNTKSTLPDQTEYNPWEITVTDSDIQLSSITINAISAQVMFDIVNDMSIADTLGTQNGIFADSAFNFLGETATSPVPSGSSVNGGVAFSWDFTDPIIDGSGLPTAQGDIYGELTLTFSNYLTQADDIFRFYLDTDLTIDGQVPEPATMILFGLGLLGFGTLGRKKLFKA